VSADDPNPLGGANLNDLAQVAADSFGDDPELEAPEISIGIEALAKAIGARMRHADWLNDPKALSVFLLSDQARDLGTKLGASLEPIIDNGSKRFAGRLWIASPVFISGYWLPLEHSEAAEVFHEIGERGVGDTAALVFDPNASDLELRFYPDGLNNIDSVRRFVIAEQVFSLDALDKVLRRFHESNIITPDAALGDLNPWNKSEQYIPRPKTEAFLQGWLKSVLSIAFADPIRIRYEYPGTEGRCDLLIVSHHLTQPNTWIYHAVLELKVLRSRTSGGKAVSLTVRASAVSDGLLQAIAYKHEHAAELGMLCCFDMRLPGHCNGDACFEPVRSQAVEHQIELRRYRLYGSSEDRRADRYGRSSTAEH
jgi:hypothetical protein